MGTEISEPTRKKHHRSSSDDDSEHSSKRRKHRHHKHHHDHRHHKHHRDHRHHHRSRSSKKELEDIPNGASIDYNHMEEGEIVESPRAKEREHSPSRHTKEDRHHRRKNREGDREGSSDRYRERKSDHSKDRYESNSGHSKYNADGDFSRDDDYKRRRHDISDKYAEKTDSFKVDLAAERDSEKPMKDEDEQEDQVAENEEDELKKIKEESRRRRQAILEKYKTKNLQELQQQVKPEPEPEQCTENEKAEEVQPPAEKSPPQKVIKLSEPKDNMFCHDVFAKSPVIVSKTGSRDRVAVKCSTGQYDNWDDAEGYYRYRIGEVLDGRYDIISDLGGGVFSKVVRAKDLKASLDEPKEVAIKIVRNNDTMLKAGMQEMVILNTLAGADPKNKRHCVRFLSSFKYRNHLCLVFESLEMSLRKAVKTFGRNIGLSLTAVRAYAKQLFIALKHLKECKVLHCDIKPDNMLVNEAKTVLKLCDFGNAMLSGENEKTPYLVSRYYRSPEVIIGLSYGHPMDMWSVGCCLFEFYTGEVLFNGRTNNDMLRLFVERKGLFPKKMVRRGAFKNDHFDQDENFLAIEEDPVTKKVVRKPILSVKPKGFRTDRILGYPGEDPKMLARFKDLLEKIFELNPDNRINVEKALSHPFITGK